VGYGADPSEVVRWAMKNVVGCVKGNHDEAAVTGDTSWFNAYAASAIRWTRGRLSEGELAFLSSLPLTYKFEVEGVRFFVVHGSPDDPLHEYVFLETHQGLFERYLKMCSADVVVLGHTHVPFRWRGAGGTVFNPGSVGQPRHGQPGAFYAVVTVEGGKVEVELKRASYDVDTAAQKIYRSGLPRVFGDRLYEGL